MNILRITIAAVLSILAGLLFLPGVSFAQDNLTVTKTIDGATATCTVLGDLSRIDCELSDTASDSNPVFILWKHGGREQRFKNNGGSGTTTNHGQGSLKYGDRTPALNWKVCVDVRFGADNCSRTVDHSESSSGEAYVIHCKDVNLDNPPSASIPPEAQPYFNCYQTEGGPTVSRKCLASIALAVAGVGKEGLDAKVFC